MTDAAAETARRRYGCPFAQPGAFPPCQANGYVGRKALLRHIARRHGHSYGAQSVEADGTLVLALAPAAAPAAAAPAADVIIAVDLSGADTEEHAPAPPVVLAVGPYRIPLPLLARHLDADGSRMTDDMVNAYALIVCGGDASLLVDSHQARFWLGSRSCHKPPPPTRTRLPRYVLLNERDGHWTLVVLDDVEQSLTIYGAYGSLGDYVRSKFLLWLGWPRCRRPTNVPTPAWVNPACDTSVYVCSAMAPPAGATTARAERDRILLVFARYAHFDTLDVLRAAPDYMRAPVT